MFCDTSAVKVHVLAGGWSDLPWVAILRITIMILTIVGISITIISSS